MTDRQPIVEKRNNSVVVCQAYYHDASMPPHAFLVTCGKFEAHYRLEQIEVDWKLDVLLESYGFKREERDGVTVWRNVGERTATEVDTQSGIQQRVRLAKPVSSMHDILSHMAIYKFRLDLLEASGADAITASAGKYDSSEAGVERDYKYIETFLSLDEAAEAHRDNASYPFSFIQVGQHVIDGYHKLED